MGSSSTTSCTQRDQVTLSLLLTLCWQLMQYNFIAYLL